MTATKGIFNRAWPQHETRAVRRVFLVTVLSLPAWLAAVACGGGEMNPSAPSAAGPSSSSPGRCRSYPSQSAIDTIGTDGAGQIVYLATARSSCAFDPRTASMTCGVTRSVTVGGICTESTSTAMTWPRVESFLDEGKPVGRILTQRVMSTVTGGRCAVGQGATTTDYQYDSQGRLTSTSGGNEGGAVYTSWDTSGRPTRGSSTGPLCAGAVIRLSYDDAARAVTQLEACPTAPTTLTTTYDGDGFPVTVGFRGTAPGAGGSNTTFRTLTSTLVCK